MYLWIYDVSGAVLMIFFMHSLLCVVKGSVNVLM